MAMTEDEFKQQAKDFIERAKAAGKSNIAITNTIKFKYVEYLREKEAEEERYWKEKEFGLLERSQALEEEKARKIDEGEFDRYEVDYDGDGAVDHIELYNPTTGERRLEPIDPAAQFDTGVDGTASDQIDTTQPAAQEELALPEYPMREGEFSVSTMSPEDYTLEGEEGYVDPEQQARKEAITRQGAFRTMADVIPKAAISAGRGLWNLRKGIQEQGRKFWMGTDPWFEQPQGSW